MLFAVSVTSSPKGSPGWLGAGCASAGCPGCAGAAGAGDGPVVWARAAPGTARMRAAAATAADSDMRRQTIDLSSYAIAAVLLPDDDPAPAIYHARGRLTRRNCASAAHPFASSSWQSLTNLGI